jgi:AcrR family transcriptional regulator
VGTDGSHRARGRGRPRDEHIDARVLETTRVLLAELGYARTTITAVARRAGVGTPAIYRRWPSRVTLIENAVFPEFPSFVLEPTGNLPADLQRYLDEYCTVLSAPAARAAVPGLISEYQTEPDAHRRIGDRVSGSTVRAAFTMLLAAAPDRDVDRAVDPDDVFDILIGAVVFHLFVRPFAGRHDDNTYITQLLLRALAPPLGKG